MKHNQKFGYLAGVLVALALLTVGAYWLQTAQVRAAPSDGTLLLGTSTKEVTPSSVSPGGVAHYAIVLRNSSAISTVTNVTVGDALPELLTYVENSAGTVPAGKAPWDTTSGHITFTVISLAPQTTVTLTFDAELNLTAESGDVISNVASLDDGVVLTWTNPATFTVSQPPVVQIATPSSGVVIEQSAGSAYAISGHAWADPADPPFLAAPVLDPLTSPDNDGTYYVNWTAVPLAQNYVLEEATALGGSWTQYQPVMSPTVSQLVTGKANGTYYYRVRAYSAHVTESRWSNVQSVTVFKTNLRYEYEPSVVAPQSVAAPMDGEVVVEVSPDDGAHWYTATVTNNAGGWWDWTYNWTLPDEEDVSHVLRARARYASGGTYGPEDSIVISVRNSIHYVYMPLVMRRWPPVPYAATLTTTATAVRGGNYTLGWSYSHAQYPPSSDSSYELQEAANNTFSNLMVLCSPQTTICGATRNLTIGLGKTPGTYYYRVRAWNNYGAGEWSNVIQVVVTAPVPYAPVLAAIDNTDGNGSYNLNWSYTEPNFLPTSYEVQEATDANFTANLKTPCTPGAATTCALTGKTVGTYFYRVRGVNAAGAGDWSAAQSATVTTISRNYNFDGSLEGWGIRRSDEPVTDSGNPIPQPISRDNKLYTMMIGAGDFAIISPLEAAPPVPYVIVTDADIVDETINGNQYAPKDQMKYSILFGANGGSPCPATENTPKNQGCFSHYYRVRVRWDAANQSQLTWALQRIDYHEGDNDQGHPPKTLAEGTVNTNANDWNKWKIAVLNSSGDNIKVYFGWSETQIASVRDTSYVNEPYFGVQIISPNWGSVATRWDWFQVTAQ